MDRLFSEVSIQGTNLGCIRLVWEREDGNLSTPAPLPGDSGRGQGLKANDQDPRDDLDSFEVSWPMRKKGVCEGKGSVGQMTFLMPFSPLTAMATPPPSSLL